MDGLRDNVAFNCAGNSRCNIYCLRVVHYTRTGEELQLHKSKAYTSSNEIYGYPNTSHVSSNKNPISAQIEEQKLSLFLFLPNVSK